MPISAMKNQPSNENVQQYGCRALNNLAKNNNDKVAIGNADGKGTIVSALVNYASNADVQTNGKEALSNFDPLGYFILGIFRRIT